MKEDWIREALILGGGVLGAVWGYILGSTLERRRWQELLGDGLEALRLRLADAVSAQNRVD